MQAKGVNTLVFTRNILFMLFLILSLGCGTAYTSTLVRLDGSTIEAVPNCVMSAEDGTLLLRGHDLGDGIPVGTVATIRSHAGVESFVIGTTAVAIAAALMIWYAVDEPRTETTWRVATGGVVSGLGLLNAITGGILWSQSASALSSRCHPRARIPS